MKGIDVIVRVGTTRAGDLELANIREWAGSKGVRWEESQTLPTEPGRSLFLLNGEAARSAEDLEKLIGEITSEVARRTIVDLARGPFIWSVLQRKQLAGALEQRFREPIGRVEIIRELLPGTRPSSPALAGGGLASDDYAHIGPEGTIFGYIEKLGERLDA